MNPRLGRIITAAVTPFAADGSLDIPRFREVLRHLARHGSDGIVVAGTTGESPTLTDDEKLELFRVAVEEVGGEVAVIAGTGGNDTAHSVELTRRACECGVDGVLVVTPYYNKPPRAGLRRHFLAVADASSVPVILYNIPARVIVNLDPELIAELAEHPNITAIKQANPDSGELAEIRRRAPQLEVYAGNDDFLYEVLKAGGVGGICVASHFVGDEMQRLLELHDAGETAAADELDARLREIYDALAAVVNPILPKAGMQLIGLDAGPLRLPMVEATDEERSALASVFERHGLLHTAVA